MSRTTLTIDRIVISPFNVRTNEKDAWATDQLQASILQFGLLQAIVVHPLDDGTYGAVAGGRRTRAITALVGRGDLPADWPVKVEIRDDLTAAELLELSLSENLRRDLRDYEVFAAVAAAHAQGDAPARIAKALGQELRWVLQAIRLGTLAPPVFDAYQRGLINTEQAKAFGATRDLDLQAQAFAALQDQPAPARSPAAIRGWYRIEDRDAEKLLRFVGREAFMAAGGWYEPDLFDDGADGRGRVADDPLLRRLADQKLAALRASIRERTGRADLRFVAQAPQGQYGGPEWILHIPVTAEEADTAIPLPEGDVVASIAIDDAGAAEVSYWWASRKAMEASKPKPATARPARTARPERVRAGAALGYQSSDSRDRQTADAVIKEEAGLTQEGTQILRSLRRVVTQAAIVQDAIQGGTLGRDYLVWAQLRMLLSTAGQYGYAEAPEQVGMRGLRDLDADPASAMPFVRDCEAGRLVHKSVEAMRKHGFMTDTDLGRAFLAFREASAATKDLAAAIVTSLALVRSLDADGYQVPVHDIVAVKAGLGMPQGFRHWWKPTGAFLDLLPTAERAAIAEPFVEAATFASWTRLKSAELTPLVLGVVTGGAGATRKLQQIAASQWVHPLLAFRRETPVHDEQQLEAAE